MRCAPAVGWRAAGELRTGRRGSRGPAAAHDLCFLAAGHQVRGEPERAQAEFDRAVAWRRQPGAAAVAADA
jgi:hypothetical protein